MLEKSERLVKTVLEQDHFYSTFFLFIYLKRDQLTTLMIWNSF
ncbi:uncharacterized protein [Blastocystis hominis]|uniref:Uncharacterized protein n=1 Tax=Blastocystis hominis TaxID=12968 RepID=D8M4Q4_BLAHO|nr:uncharacterized protein [Blastocystis hominis]CBK23043.2 unnamed protein product [Blastocystis hominis]|eukprot:XP_012897091.1 uncharacterized protein [Blastocystis hominis]